MLSALRKAPVAESVLDEVHIDNEAFLMVGERVLRLTGASLVVWRLLRRGARQWRVDAAVARSMSMRRREARAVTLLIYQDLYNNDLLS